MNGLYSNQIEKQYYNNNPKLYIDGFWVSFLGLLGIRLFTEDPAYVNYLNRNSNIMQYQVTDDYDNLNDYLVSIKVLVDNNILNKFQAMSIFSYINDIKNNKYKTNDSKLKSCLKNINIYKIPCNQEIMNKINNYIYGKYELKNLIVDVCKFNEKFKISKALLMFYQNNKLKIKV